MGEINTMKFIQNFAMKSIPLSLFSVSLIQESGFGVHGNLKSHYVSKISKITEKINSNLIFYYYLFIFNPLQVQKEDRSISCGIYEKREEEIGQKYRLHL